jgi:hypothetical protein
MNATHLSPPKPHTRLLLLCASLSLGALPACAASSPSASLRAGAETIGRPISRKPLGELAVDVGVHLHKGFVLGAPALHDLPITVYIPADASPDQTIEILRAALASHDLTLTERASFWFIDRAPAPPAAADPLDSPLRHTDGGLLIDLDQVRLVEVTRTLSQLGGHRFLIAPELTEHRVTIQALRAVSPDEALHLLIDALTLDGIRVQRRGDTVLIGVAPAPSSTTEDHDGPVIPPRASKPGAATDHTPRPMPETVP